MVNPKLADYIKSKRLSGASDDTIRNELLQNKWSPIILDEAFGIVVTGTSVEPNHYLSIGELLSKSISVFGNRFLGAFLITLIPSVLIILLSVSIGFSTAISVNFMGMIKSNMAISLTLGVVALIAFIFIIILQMWGGIAMLFSLFSGEKVGTWEAYKKSWRLVRSLLWINILTMLIVSSGFVLLVIPGVVFGIWFVFSQFVFIDEEIGGLDALMTSREYVRGMALSIFLRLVLLMILFAVIELIFVGITTALKIDKNAFVGLLNGVLNMFMGIFASVYLITMYKNIKSVKSGHVDIADKSKVGFVILSILGIFCFLGIPLFVVLVAINPAKQISKAREARSAIDRISISNGVIEYFAEKNELPISVDQLVPVYLKSIPVNPNPMACYRVVVKKATSKVFVNDVEKTLSDCDTRIILE